MNENPYQAPESTDRAVSGNSVTVQISEAWVRRLNSPMFVVVGALTGVSISFAPFGLTVVGYLQQMERVDYQRGRCVLPDDLFCALVLHAAGGPGDWATGQQEAGVVMQLLAAAGAFTVVSRLGILIAVD